MLYTGGTTGMPKGVMYAMGGLTAVVRRESGFPLLGLAAPTDAADDRRAASRRQRRRRRALRSRSRPARSCTAPGVWLGAFIPHLAGGTVITLESRSLDAHELLAAVQRASRHRRGDRR